MRHCVCLLLLLAMLLLQAQVALAGCLIAGGEYADVAGMVDMPQGCDQGDTAVMRACIQQCEQVSEAPTTSGASSASGLFEALLPDTRWTAPTLPGITYAAALCLGEPPPASGPPMYLRLLRLLN